MVLQVEVASCRWKETGMEGEMLKWNPADHTSAWSCKAGATDSKLNIIVVDVAC